MHVLQACVWRHADVQPSARIYVRTYPATYPVVPGYRYGTELYVPRDLAIDGSFRTVSAYVLYIYLGEIVVRVCAIDH